MLIFARVLFIPVSRLSDHETDPNDLDDLDDLLARPFYSNGPGSSRLDIAYLRHRKARAANILLWPTLLLLVPLVLELELEPVPVPILNRTARFS